MFKAIDYSTRLKNNYRILAESFLEQDNVEKALKFYEKSKVYMGESQDIDLLLDIGFIYYENENLEESKNTFLDASTIDETEPRAYFGLGIVNEELGEYEAAEEAYLKALELDELYQQAYFFIAGLYQKMGDFEKSEKNYFKSLELNSKDYWAITNLGSLYEEFNMNIKAEKYFKKAYEINKNNPTSAFNLGVVNGKMGKFDEAKKYYKASMELDPNNPSIYLNLSLLYKVKSDYMTSLHWLTEGIKYKADSGFLYYHRSCINVLLGNQEDAVKDARKACLFDDYFVDYIQEDPDLESIKDAVLD
jgi:tetratricopeptide (TPR) repeat protein